MTFARLHVLSALVAAIIVFHGPEPGLADDIGTNFFLKASKSVPRIGRRSPDFDNHFLKASKSVPRIGRRGLGHEAGQLQDIKGYPIIRNAGPEVYLAETAAKLTKRLEFYPNSTGSNTGRRGQPLWSDFEKAYESFPRSDILRGLRDNLDANDLYWPKMKKDSEIEEPRFQQEIY